jgi:hypothetical protein
MEGSGIPLEAMNARLSVRVGEDGREVAARCQVVEQTASPRRGKASKVGGLP